MTSHNKGYDNESDGAKLGRMGTDAQKWTREFMRMFPFAYIAGDEGVELDTEGMLLVWFANAIEAGRTAGQHHAPRHRSLPRLRRGE